MLRLLNISILILAMSIASFAQVPQALKYKGIAKNYWGWPLPNKNVTLRFTILQDYMEVYQETHHVRTNKFGLIDANVGEGEANIGQFDAIEWGLGEYHLRVELDPKGGANFKIKSKDKLLSVPFALFAGRVANSNNADTDPGNELISDMYLTGTSLYIVEGSQTTMVDLESLSNDADPENEIQDLQLNGHILTITLNGTPAQIDLSPYLDNTDTQQLSISGNLISLTNGGSIELPQQTGGEGSFYYGDKDGDGFGDKLKALWVPALASVPEGYLADNTDCNDENAAINPDAIDIPGDGIDSDCDGVDTDPNADADADRDGYSINQGDCNDNDNTIYPGATEICGDGIDQDCDGKYLGCPVTDIDGNTYSTVEIGDQVWMAENLKVTHYPNGSPIPLVTDNTVWANLADNDIDRAYCYSQHGGALYTYASVTNGDNDGTTQGVCPTGWHLPSDMEWKELEMFLGMSQTAADDTGGRGTNEGSKLAGSAGLWRNGNLDQNADFGASGFSALPYGVRNGYDGTFFLVGYYSCWWSSTEFNTSKAYYRGLGYDRSDVGRSSRNKSSGLSVRCLRD